MSLQKQFEIETFDFFFKIFFQLSCRGIGIQIEEVITLVEETGGVPTTSQSKK